jgi:DNA-binding LacI/PurR family transcriptional regulator
MSISDATKERVRQAARDLGYTPHGIARALREGSSRIVVLTVNAGFDGHYARSYISGLDDELGSHGFSLLVRHGQATGELLDSIAPRAVLDLASNYLEPGHEFDDGGWEGGLAGNVLVQLRYLTSRGHDRLAVALPEGGTPLGPIRLRFAAEAAEMLGIPAPVTLLMPRERSSCADALAAFRSAAGDVTAITCFDDDVALRVLAGLSDLGLTAPDDLAVIGFDETACGAYSVPALTTVRIDAEDHGRKTARVILGLGTDGFIAAPAEVIARESA